MRGTGRESRRKLPLADARAKVRVPSQDARVTKPPRPAKTPTLANDAQSRNRSRPRAEPKGETRPERSRPRGGSEPHRTGHGGGNLVYGFHAARAALTGKRRRILAVQATEAAATRLAAEIQAADVQARIVTAEDLARRLGPQAVHQGVLVETGPFETIDLADIVARSGVILVLDQITDPHNVGAILRTAAAYAVDALVTTTRHTPELAGVVAKVASGGLDHVPVAEVTNLARALEELGDMGYLRVGLDSEGPVPFAATDLRRPLALVFGAEGKGLRRLTRENCDALARLDMPGAIKSLNVSNACAVTLALASLRLAATG